MIVIRFGLQFLLNIFLIFGVVQSSQRLSIFTPIESFGHVLQDSLKGFLGDAETVVQDDTTKVTCGMRTDQLIEHFGYYAEEHTVITDDGYILTVFRCQSRDRKPHKGAVLLLHGLISSSDDFCGCDKALAYVMADAGYDVWLSNDRGNFYSKQHLHLNPGISGEFWNFSFHKIALFDLTAFIEYVIDETKLEKVHLIGHSQGTASVMCLLSEKPEYNSKVAAVSLMAPSSYLGHSKGIFGVLAQLTTLLEPVKNTEFLSRDYLGGISGTICDTILVGSCQTIIDLFFGPSNKNRNDAMLPSLMCHIPSGISTTELLHFGDEMRLNYFGPPKEGSEPPRNFDLLRITAPTIMHFAPTDVFASAIDINRLIAELKNCLAYVNNINQTEFNHVDFIWDPDAYELVYLKTIAFFDEHH